MNASYCGYFWDYNLPAIDCLLADGSHSSGDDALDPIHQKSLNLYIDARP